MRKQMLYRALAAICGAAILSTAAWAQQLPAGRPWKCPGNLVTNDGFNLNTVIVGDGSMPASRTDAWTSAYGTPQLQSGDGCHDPYYISFWGNQAVGEAIQQPLVLQPGVVYSYEFCARFHHDNGKVPQNVTIVMRASIGPLTNPTCPSGPCETIATTPSITSQNWATFTGCFTVKQPTAYLTISPSNGSSALDGAQTSFGQIDNVCIREVKAPVIEGPANTCTIPATYCVKSPATGPFTWTATNGTTQPVNADGSCVLVTWGQNNPSGSVHVISTVNGCKITSHLNVGECLRPPCCHHVLKASLVKSEPVSGGAALTVALGGPPATLVKAKVLGASRVWQTPGCGTNGTITATASSSQPPAPSGWNGPVVPFLNGNEVIWQSNAAGGNALGQFTMNVQLPSTGSMKCNDSITVCIEFEVTLPAANGLPCRTCTIVQCFTIERCPSCP